LGARPYGVTTKVLDAAFAEDVSVGLVNDNPAVRKARSTLQTILSYENLSLLITGLRTLSLFIVTEPALHASAETTPLKTW
jgi:hypothetical protein